MEPFPLIHNQIKRLETTTTTKKHKVRMEGNFSHLIALLSKNRKFTRLNIAVGVVSSVKIHDFASFNGHSIAANYCCVQYENVCWCKTPIIKIQSSKTGHYQMNAECISSLSDISGDVEYRSCDSHMSYCKLPPNFMCPPFVHRHQNYKKGISYQVCHHGHAPNTKYKRFCIS